MKFIKLPAVVSKTGLSKSTIYSMIALGLFPKQVTVGRRRVCWLEDEIEKWMLDKVSKSVKPAQISLENL